MKTEQCYNLKFTQTYWQIQVISENGGQLFLLCHVSRIKIELVREIFCDSTVMIFPPLGLVQNIIRFLPTATGNT